MSKADFIIIGAGACGLVAARELSRKGWKVILLEARDRTGGRICTLHEDDFLFPLEAGAEFIHGDLKVTLSLLNEYGIAVHPMHGIFWQSRKDDVSMDPNMIAGHHRLLVKFLDELKYDMSVEAFLQTYFEDEKYSDLKSSIRGFVQGYDAADTFRASTFAFRHEWLQEDDGQQYRIDGGYSRLTDALEADCKRHSCEVLLSSPVKKVEWTKNNVEAITADGRKYKAARAIITLPLGVLTSQETSQGNISFSKVPGNRLELMKMLGYGGAMKISMQFKNMFWAGDDVKNLTGRDLSNLGFVFSDASIPTWWTQYPIQSNTLTGWIAGPASLRKSQLTREALIEEAVNSIAHIFRLPEEHIRNEIISCRIFDWVNDPYSSGGYAYAVVNGDEVKRKIHEPVEDTLFFAGEALHEGDDAGTVEAALSEGFRVSRKAGRD